jgi:hypothetical protein
MRVRVTQLQLESKLWDGNTGEIGYISARRPGWGTPQSPSHCRYLGYELIRLDKYTPNNYMIYSQ